MQVLQKLLPALAGAGRKIQCRSQTTSRDEEQAKPFEEIPHATMIPFIGTSWLYFPLIGPYKVDMHHVAFREKQERFGDILREKYGSMNIVLCYLPEHFQLICQLDGLWPSRGEVSSVKAYRDSRKEWYSTTGLLALQGQEWRDLRKKTQIHLMTSKAVLSYLPTMQKIARDLVCKFTSENIGNESIDLLEGLHKWALESVAFVALDTRLGCLQPNLPKDSDAMRMIQAVQTQMSCMNELEAISGNIQFWKFFPTPTWRKFVRANDVITEISFKYIKQAVRSLKELPDEKKSTFLHNLLYSGMNIPDAMVSVTDVIISGIDTTSHAMGFLLYNLAKNLEKQEILYQEIVKNLPSEDDDITPTTLGSLRYLKACQKESHRLYPIASGIPRLLKKDVVLSGYKVPAGTIVVVLHHVIGRDPRFFHHPEDYLPERWLRSERTESVHPYAQAPFGFGIRSCIGRRIAEQKMACLAIELLRKFRLEYHGEDIGIKTRMLNVPDRPIRCAFIKRHQ